MKHVLLAFLLSGLVWGQFLDTNDLDQDGIINANDLDDDNDGILDCTESYTGPLDLSAMTSTSPNYSQHPIAAYSTISSSASVSGSIYSGYPKGNATGTIVNVLTGPIGTNNTTQWTFSENTKIHISYPTSSDGIGGFYFTYDEIHEFDAGGNSIYLSDPNNELQIWDGSSWVAVPTNYSSTFIRFRMRPNGGTNGGNSFVYDGSIAFRFSTNTNQFTWKYINNYASTNGTRLKLEVECAPIDTDGDGIADKFDLDSDNDGCPDALEGAGSTFLVSDLHSNGSVNTSISTFQVDTNSSSSSYGSPASTQNGIGTSTNSTIQSAECDPCNANSSQFSDSDGDGVGDECDLDNDNDGILDTVECEIINRESGGTFGTSSTSLNRDLEVAPSQYYTWASASNTTSGQYAVINGYNDNFHYFFNSLVGHTTGTQDDAYLAVNGNNNPGVFYRQQIGLSPNSSYDIEFWAANANSTASGAANYPVELGFRLLDETGTQVILESSTGVISTSHEWKRSHFAYTTNATQTQFILEVYNISLGVAGNDFAIDDIIITGCADTDGDGITDNLDLDSDNDGCPDALEGNGGFTSSQLNLDAIAGNVDSDGIPTIANGGQNRGSSNDSTTLGGECATIATWSCNSSFYQLYNGNYIAELNPSLENYTLVAEISNTSTVLTASYNSMNNNVYAFATTNGITELVKIGVDGTLYPQGFTTNLAIQSSCFDSQDNLFVLTSTGAILKLNLNTVPFIFIDTAINWPNVDTIAFDSSSGNIYGLASEGSVNTFNTTTQTQQSIQLSGGISLDTGEIGALWTTQEGILFAYSNSSGKIYNIDFDTQIGFETLNTTSNLMNNEGFNCYSATPPLETSSTDGIDNDGDGLIDCNDSDQTLNPACIAEICNNGIDDDGDGMIDCQDGDCYSSQNYCIEICDNGIDDDGDGMIDEEDSQCTASAGVSGGLESNNRLSQKIAERNYQNRLYRTEEFTNKMNGTTVFLKTRDSQLTIEDFIPSQIQGLTVSDGTPSDLVEITNATDVAAADYYYQSTRIGSILGITSENGVYEHTKFICDRLGGATLVDVSYVLINNVQLIQFELLTPEGNHEYAANIVMYKDEEGFHLENHWNTYNYSTQNAYFNLQVWANSPNQLIQLLNALMNEINLNGTVASSQCSQAPRLFVKKGAYKNGTLKLNIRNKTQALQMQIVGQLSRVEGGQSEPFTQTIALSGAPEQSIEINTPFLYDYGFTVMSEGSLNDDLFVSDGTWLSDESHQGVSQVDFMIYPQSENLPQEDMYLLERSISAQAQVRTYYNISRSITPKYTGFDLTPYQHLAFTAAGNGALQITLVKNEYNTWEEQFRLQIQLSEIPTQYLFSLEDFQSLTHSELILEDVVMVVFSLVGDGQTTQSRSLQLENLRFTNAESLSVQDIEFTQLTLFPNPAFDKVHIHADKNMTSLQIFNASGQIVNRITSIHSENIQWNVNNLPTGVYWIKVQFEDGDQQTYKLIKNE